LPSRLTVESSRVVAVHLVEHGVQETERSLVVHSTSVVQQSNQSSGNGSSSGGTGTNANATTVDGQQSGTDSGEVGVASVGSVEELGGRNEQVGCAQVLLHEGGLATSLMLVPKARKKSSCDTYLIRGHGSDFRETTTSCPSVVATMKRELRRM
jgi:hypothetical protein